MLNTFLYFVTLALLVLILYKIIVAIIQKTTGATKTEAEKKIHDFINNVETYHIACDVQLEADIWLQLKSILDIEHFNSIKRLSSVERICSCFKAQGVNCIAINIMEYTSHSDNVERLKRSLEKMLIQYLHIHNLPELTFSIMYQYNDYDYIYVYFAENQSELNTLRRIHETYNKSKQTQYRKIANIIEQH